MCRVREPLRARTFPAGHAMQLAHAIRAGHAVQAARGMGTEWAE
jgi:hypothetical protein